MTRQIMHRVSWMVFANILAFQTVYAEETPSQRLKYDSVAVNHVYVAYHGRPMPTMISPSLLGLSTAQKKTFAEYIKDTVPVKREIDVFLNERSWARFDRDLGYVLGNYMPRDGMTNSSSISTIRSNGARTSFMYRDKPCRINTTAIVLPSAIR